MTTPDASLSAARTSYAEEIRAVAHLTSDAVVAAYARVPREVFLGTGPWQISLGFDREPAYRTTPDSSPTHLYHDVVVGIDPSRLLNNGQPSALARWIEAVAPRAGDTVLHVGCGTGYYTAIFAELVGPTGRVIAHDVDAGLAARARATLAAWPQVTVVDGDGTPAPGPCDIVFVNCGATHPRREWIDALAPGGRLFVPVTIHLPGIRSGVGIGLCIAQADGDRWPVRIVSQIGIYDCANARDPDAERQLAALAATQSAERIHALSVAPHERGASCLVHLPHACLQE